MPARPSALPCLEPLERRALLANTFAFDDEDGDLVTVKLTGPGTVSADLSQGTLGFIDALHLIGTTGASSLSISVKQQGGDGRLSLFDMDDGALRSVNAPSVDILFTATFTLTEITAFKVGDIGSMTDPTLHAPAGKAMTISAREVRGDLSVTGRVKSLKIDSANGAANFIGSGGPVDALTCAGGLDGEWIFDSLKSLKVGGVLSAALWANVPDAKGYTIGAIKAQSAADATLGLIGLSAPGRVKSLTVDSWTGGDIRERAIDTLKVKGDFTPATFTLDADIQAGFSAMKSATIGGVAGGAWLWQAAVGTLKIGQTDANLSIQGFGAGATMGTLAFTGDQPIVGSFTFASIKTLTAKSDLGGDWSVTGVDAAGLSIKSIASPRIVNMRIDSGVGGGIGAITTNHLEGADLHGQFFNSVNVKKGKSGAGDMILSVLRAGSQNVDGLSIGKLTVAGTSNVSTIITRSSVKALSFGKVFEGIVYVGNVNAFGAPTPLFGDTADLDTQASIGSFTVTGAFDPQNLTVAGLIVTTARIDTVTIKGAVQQTFGATNGFAAAIYGTVTMKDAGGATLTPVLLPGNNNPFAPAASDFVFRIFDL